MEERTVRNQKLAEALSRARAVANSDIVRSADLDRQTRERLVAANYLTEVIRGWYILTTPSGAGTTTLWYGNYWNFVREYLKDRFGPDGYCLTPESSMDLYSGQNYISEQLTVMTKKPSNQPTNLLFGTSLMFYKDENNFPPKVSQKRGVNVFSLSEALALVSPNYFKSKSLNVEITLKSLSSVPDLSRVLLERGLVSSAGRLAGAFEKLGDPKSADQIMSDMTSAGYSVKTIDPFEDRQLFLKDRPRSKSPHASRIEALWLMMREDVIKVFPPPRQKKPNDGRTLQIIEKLYTQDAYHSLSIEGYQVTEDLIEKVKLGQYDPEQNEADQETRDALAAKGYFLAFERVKASVEKVIIKKQDPSKVVSDDLQDWYRNLFAPLVTSQLERPSQLAGYRNTPVYIKNSRHVPVAVSGVLDSMETLENLLKGEENPAVKAVLGHFIFGFIHPYRDGNGRIARFLMNLMLIGGGYTWTVIRTSERSRYLASLEEASVNQNITNFAIFIKDEMAYWREFVKKNFPKGS